MCWLSLVAILFIACLSLVAVNLSLQFISVPFLQINLIVYGFIVPSSNISPITTLSIIHSNTYLSNFGIISIFLNKLLNLFNLCLILSVLFVSFRRVCILFAIFNNSTFKLSNFSVYCSLLILPSKFNSSRLASFLFIFSLSFSSFVTIVSVVFSFKMFSIFSKKFSTTFLLSLQSILYPCTKQSSSISSGIALQCGHSSFPCFALFMHCHTGFEQFLFAFQFLLVNRLPQNPQYNLLLKEYFCCSYRFFFLFLCCLLF